MEGVSYMNINGDFFISFVKENLKKSIKKLKKGFKVIECFKGFKVVEGFKGFKVIEGFKGIEGEVKLFFCKGGKGGGGNEINMEEDIFKEWVFIFFKSKKLRV